MTSFSTGSVNNEDTQGFPKHDNLDLSETDADSYNIERDVCI